MGAVTIPWSETIEMYYLKFWSPEVQNQGTGRVAPLLEALNEGGLFPFLMASGVPWLVGCVTPVSAFIFVSVPQISLTLSLKGHLPFDL